MVNGDDQAFVLIVEDDPQVRSLVSRLLSRDGYDVSAVGTALDARAAFKAKVPHLVLLDLGLPGTGGLDLGRWIRNSYPAVGIIIVTGKSEVDDRIAGLDSGADDYVTKPFDTDELRARVRSLLRRMAIKKQTGPTDLEVARIGRWGLAPDQCALVSGEHRIKLTLTEFRLLEALATRPNRTVTREWLRDRLEIDEDAGERVIDYHIHAVRGKLRDCGFVGEVITSIRGVGYCFAPPNAVSPMAPTNV